MSAIDINNIDKIDFSVAINNNSIIDINKKDKKKKVYKRPGRFTTERIDYNRKLLIRARLESGESIRNIALTESMSPNTVRAILKDNSISQKSIEYIKKNLAGKFYAKSNTALETINQTKLDESSALQLMTLAGIGVDKARLIEGQSTQNIALHTVIEAIEAKHRRMKQLRGQESKQEDPGNQEKE